MTVTIDLPPEIEAKLREQATIKGAKLEDYLSELAQHWASGNGTSSPPMAPESKTQEQWEKEWREWAASHKPVGVAVDDSRESIYAGRGE